MNATRMSKIVVLLGMGLVTGFTVTASAQAPTNTPPATESTREAVDAKLAEAKTAIAAGDLQKAERLLTEADQANVRYPLFHFGDTPSTVRRELMRAQSTVAADPFPNSVPMPTQPTQPARMVDPAVMPVAANGPYGNYREELPGALPGMPQAGAAPNGAMPPAAAPANYPTTDPQVQPSALNLGSAATPNRYAAPAGMMDTNQGVGNTAQQMPGISDLRFAQAPGTPAPEALPSNGAQSLLQAGESALRKGDREQALQLFRQANANRNDLDPTARQLLDSHLRMLSSAPETLDVAPTATPIANAEANIEALDSQQQVLVRQLNADVGRAQGLARKAVEKDPKEAVRLLDEVEAQVNKSGLDDST